MPNYLSKKDPEGIPYLYNAVYYLGGLCPPNPPR